MKTHPLYKTWKSMRWRCRHDPRYVNRGTVVCSRWDSFELFAADVGPKPSPSHSLDRIDNNGPYAPWNCRWATRKEQASNRSYRTGSTSRPIGTCGLRWVEPVGLRFMARIKLKGKRYYLGTHPTAEKAHLTACAFKLENHWSITT